MAWFLADKEGQGVFLRNDRESTAAIAVEVLQQKGLINEYLTLLQALLCISKREGKNDSVVETMINVAEPDRSVVIASKIVGDLKIASKKMQLTRLAAFRSTLQKATFPSRSEEMKDFLKYSGQEQSEDSTMGTSTEVVANILEELDDLIVLVGSL
eukprot:CAMPEP_0116847350 /NCGR_PEP_ID=MMETSP0418-20121206/14386_1 /TAXON_ID=1158023 /ORGANISM="Astrosyne radiata, Strain 13vi08-1A" /LENGTH=155 /DNA_ID=CAMNT_0004478787 /DNA_START=209 /DNA_END=673 /DNA_ORIENTATION=+